MRLRFFFIIPFFSANASHLVWTLGFGTGFSRGNGVVVSGSTTSRPPSFGRPASGSEKTLRIINWTRSVARSAKYFSPPPFLLGFLRECSVLISTQAEQSRPTYDPTVAEPRGPSHALESLLIKTTRVERGEVPEVEHQPVVRRLLLLGCHHSGGGRRWRVSAPPEPNDGATRATAGRFGRGTAAGRRWLEWRRAVQLQAS